MGKKANIFVKVLRCVFCLDEKFEMSIAIIRPRVVTRSAISFKVIGIVRICVFIGMVQLITNIPAIMLPQASRVMGPIMRGLFSLIGGIVEDRGVFIDEKKIIRKL